MMPAPEGRGASGLSAWLVPFAKGTAGVPPGYATGW
ncbi:hypothetical protein GGD64_007602 [Bradyrhizobium sp. CIR3A]|nr:hypothetical protein [Bradyrhizobium sp. CIR3A]NYG49015.1 hypothetical protein [Bradyrhizobium sp. IAR9]